LDKQQVFWFISDWQTLNVALEMKSI